MSPYALAPDGLLLAVRLTPRARANGVDGLACDEQGRALLQIRLVAPPVEGAANDALVAWLGAELGLRRSAIRIVAGARARIKRLHLAGDPQALARRVDAWIA